MKCSKCGYENDINNIRCVNCNQELNQKFNFKESYAYKKYTYIYIFYISIFYITIFMFLYKFGFKKFFTTVPTIFLILFAIIIIIGTLFSYLSLLHYIKRKYGKIDK